MFYAIEHDLPQQTATELIALVFPVVAISIVIHGLSVTPLANLYDARKEAVGG